MNSEKDYSEMHSFDTASKSLDAAEEAALQVDERNLTRQALWERKLLDFSLRNNLLNMRLGKRAIQLISFEISKMEDFLQTGENFSIQPWTTERKLLTADDGLFHSSIQAAALQEQFDSDIKSHKLGTYLSDTELKSATTNLYRGARTALEENGANALFISIGVLRWYVTENSNQPRYAPILLLPVNLVRSSGGYIVRLRDEETILNITLVEFLHQQFKLSLPSFNPLPKDESGVDVPRIIDTLRKLISQQKNWEVLDECVLGLFSFNKFVMWNDIHTNAAKLRESPIVQSLIERRLTLPLEESTIDIQAFDHTARPLEVATPISVDSSQLEAVIESGQGKSFILYGPPGTGKSQTITNIIANALYKGKRILFVAEKMAALQVVQKRLSKIGLEPFCLELHSNKVTKTHFLQQLQSALDVKHGHINDNFAQRADELFALRQQLNGHMKAMHEVRDCGQSLYDCIEHYLDLCKNRKAPDNIDEFTLHTDFISKLNVNDINSLIDELTKLDTTFRITGHPAGHPLSGLVLTDDSREVLDYTEHLLKAFTADSTDTPATLVSEWQRVKARWFIPRFFAKRCLLKRLRHYEPSLKSSNIENFIKHLALIEHPESIPTWLAHRAEWTDWAQWSVFRQSLIKQGFQPVVTYIEEGHTGIEASFALSRILNKEWALRIIDSDSNLRRFNGLAFADVIARYRQLSNHFQDLTKLELYCRLATRIPSISMEAASGSEVNILKRNIANGGRGTSIRHIIDQIPNLLPKLCPCMLMSPISVAQFIDLKQPKFDLVIFDEASQMPTSEAIGAIGRGRALIVVGDNRQMPPTSFFAAQQVDDEDAEFDDLDSILDDCHALSVPSHYLAFHYRSRHESLIAFSNTEFYDGRLFTFPSADDRVSKVSLIKVEGTYDKGGRRSNRAEAEAVVAEVVRRLSDDKLSQRSLGVVAFSMAQQNLIEDVLMEAIGGNKELEHRAFDAEEPIFIKNLENVQGDERDVILFSVGYGPDKNGNVSMNFGPLNNRGGERRLNVAVSRARYEMIVFSTLSADQIDLSRSKAAGVEGLRKFLKYAETSELATDNIASGTIKPESMLTSNAQVKTLAQDVAEAINQRGYETTTGVGRSQFKVDVAVIDPSNPERYLLGILIDGRERYSTCIARDRELSQPQVLQGLGWKVFRLWAVDWMMHRERVITELIKAIESPNTPSSTIEEPLSLPELKIITSKAKTPAPKVQTEFNGKADIDKISSKNIDAAIMHVVSEQVALPREDLLRATSRVLGFQHRGTRIDAVIEEHIASLIANNQIRRDGNSIVLK